MRRSIGEKILAIARDDLVGPMRMRCLSLISLAFLFACDQPGSGVARDMQVIRGLIENARDPSSGAYLVPSQYHQDVAVCVRDTLYQSSESAEAYNRQIELLASRESIARNPGSVPAMEALGLGVAGLSVSLLITSCSLSIVPTNDLLAPLAETLEPSPHGWVDRWGEALAPLAETLEPSPNASAQSLEFDVQSDSGMAEGVPERHERRLTFPERGSEQRASILDAVRPVAERDLGRPIEFMVRDVRVVGDYAFVDVNAQRPGGEPIDPKKTPFASSHPDELFAWDCCHAQAVLRNISGQWRVEAAVVGATDVWYLEWCDRVPQDLIQGCR